MKKIAIVGSGGLGREILGIIHAINNVNKIWDFIGFYDDNPSLELVNDYSIVGKIEELNSIEEELCVVIGVGNPKIKELLFKKITNAKISYPSLVHPSVILYSKETVVIGKGVVVGANCVLTVNITIADFVYLNTASVISHDTKIDQFSMVMPTVSISAGATIGKRVYLGNGTKIDYNIIIEDDAIIKAGTILSQ